MTAIPTVGPQSAGRAARQAGHAEPLPGGLAKPNIPAALPGSEAPVGVPIWARSLALTAAAVMAAGMAYIAGTTVAGMAPHPPVVCEVPGPPVVVRGGVAYVLGSDTHPAEVDDKSECVA